MNVTELVDLVAQLSFGRDMSTLKERANYVRFLNLANLELYQLLINSPYFFLMSDIFFTEDSNSADISEYYYIKHIFSNKSALKRSKPENIMNIPAGEYIISNRQLILSKANLSYKEDPSDNIRKKYVTLLILPNPKQLVENITDRINETDIPIYPEPYHLALVHGALYYLCISSKGFFEKINYHLNSWKQAKDNLSLYYS